jgi:hypothetical protein
MKYAWQILMQIPNAKHCQNPFSSFEKEIEHGCPTNTFCKECIISEFSPPLQKSESTVSTDNLPMLFQMVVKML